MRSSNFGDGGCHSDLDRNVVCFHYETTKISDLECIIGRKSILKILVVDQRMAVDLHI